MFFLNPCIQNYNHSQPKLPSNIIRTIGPYFLTVKTGLLMILSIKTYLKIKLKQVSCIKIRILLTNIGEEIKKKKVFSVKIVGESKNVTNNEILCISIKKKIAFSFLISILNQYPYHTGWYLPKDNVKLKR